MPNVGRVAHVGDIAVRRAYPVILILATGSPNVSKLAELENVVPAHIFGSEVADLADFADNSIVYNFTSASADVVVIHNDTIVHNHTDLNVIVIGPSDLANVSDFPELADNRVIYNFTYLELILYNLAIHDFVYHNLISGYSSNDVYVAIVFVFHNPIIVLNDDHIVRDHIVHNLTNHKHFNYDLVNHDLANYNLINYNHVFNNFIDHNIVFAVLDVYHNVTNDDQHDDNFHDKHDSDYFRHIINLNVKRSAGLPNLQPATGAKYVRRHHFMHYPRRQISLRVSRGLQGRICGPIVPGGLSRIRIFGVRPSACSL
ncbi:hypothetical protein JDV02_003339 [Purpureocillium takamizusanense]|uniref:Uncharacterized protein n=1 Tax=Purpureocillium takamizusanense TaxID=2060973 RepID=A0A9Q8QDX3_9HYPO|nr:uncharacterized protein JDV02_003339 [Purpureocillium takamizusanense]UNI16957.1 hypothetical protein JDV02_003339 [Purpureocillium takamizusanense]